MVNKYAKALEEGEINSKTNKVWNINDVPNAWRAKTEAKVLADGYELDEEGYAHKVVAKTENEVAE